ncbi:MAG TPA: CPBP family intramembrane glutamic endopeptidase [Chitinophagaceae bacterium]|jgi:membrane protease YdiL (CAAX protease family)|nr:CPBP family intramembrane glutamic endopeptidase [Chitinophagaceae bacterium]
MLIYIITYGSLLFFFPLFFIAVYASDKCDSGNLKGVLSGKGKPDVLLRRLIAGIIFLGIGTIVILINRDLESNIFVPSLSKDASPWMIIAAVAIFTGTFSAFKKLSLSQENTDSLSSNSLLSFLVIRILFLLVYEFFFRGALFFMMVEDFGVTTAIIVNIILYVLVHWFNKEERYGSVLMGGILCGVTLYYNSVWPAIIIHLSLALSHDITLLINNKSLIKKSWS